MRTFSTAPKGHPRYDELSYARIVAQRFGTEHHEVLIDEDDLEGYIPQLIEHHDEPTSDWTAIPQHFVSKLARDTGTMVVQVGEGADEIFHGYKGYVDHRRFVVPSRQHVPGWAQRPIGSAAVWATQRLGRGIRHGEAISTPRHRRSRTGAGRCASADRSKEAHRARRGRAAGFAPDPGGRVARGRGASVPMPTCSRR